MTAGGSAADPGPMRDRLALHTWSLDTTPLARVLEVARATGWNAVELRRLDFERAREAGQPPDAVLDLVRASGLAVACVGGERGFMFAVGAERRRVMAGWVESCRWARALGAGLVMSPTDPGDGDVAEAAASVRAVGDVAGEHGLRVALEAFSQAARFRTLGHAREILAKAGHPACGLLVDAYHLVRSGDGLATVEDLAPEEIVYVQYSDAPREGSQPGQTADRLPPGQGRVPFRELFALLAAKGYRGYLSYEAPNPAAWARPPEDVAREAVTATRALLPD
jgi:2-keto-myo-inositol isomerase